MIGRIRSGNIQGIESIAADASKSALAHDTVALVVRPAHRERQWAIIHLTDDVGGAHSFDDLSSRRNDPMTARTLLASRTSPHVTNGLISSPTAARLAAASSRGTGPNLSAGS